MRKINKILILIINAAIAFNLSGCGKPVINSESDEIRLYSWEYMGEQGIRSELKFTEDCAALTIDNDNEHCKISGLCVIEGNYLVIIDNSLHKEYLFEYILSGTELTLVKGGEKVSFIKCAE